MEKTIQAGNTDCRPTAVTYNAVINAFAKSKMEDAAERAEEILLKMEKMYEAGADIQPNTRSFNSVMNAWAKSSRDDAADHAQELFDFMNGLYKKTNKSVRPDVHSYCTVINGELCFGVVTLRFDSWKYLAHKAIVNSPRSFFAYSLQHGDAVKSLERQSMPTIYLSPW